MPYTLLTSKRVEQELNTLPASVYQRARQAVNDLCINPRPASVRKMQGSASTYRVRVGDYRIVYELDDAAQTIQLSR